MPTTASAAFPSKAMNNHILRYFTIKNRTKQIFKKANDNAVGLKLLLATLWPPAREHNKERSEYFRNTDKQTPPHIAGHANQAFPACLPATSPHIPYPAIRKTPSPPCPERDMFFPRHRNATPRSEPLASKQTSASPKFWLHILRLFAWYDVWFCKPRTNN